MYCIFQSVEGEEHLKQRQQQQQQQQQQCPPKPQHTLQYQQEQLSKQQQQWNNNNKNKNYSNNSVMAAIRKLEPGTSEQSTTVANTERMMEEIMMEKPSVQSEAELRLAYISQCAELKLLRRQLLAKDRQIRELQLLLDQTNTCSRR
ncbi:hypothetical protein FHG87_024760 [Trinorchestia longiramus]|nr:hypothetical protein FHG87_024760 [Trinorchestia longiramus]